MSLMRVFAMLIVIYWVSPFLQPFLPLPHHVLLDPARLPLLLSDHHAAQPLQQDLLLAEQVVLLHLPPPLPALLHLIVLGVPRGLELVLRAGGALVEVVVVIVVVAVDDADQLLQLLPGLHALGGNLLIADMQQILCCCGGTCVCGWRYLEGVIGFDHVVEGVDGEVVVDDLLLALALLVGETQVDVDDLLYLLTAVLDVQESVEDLVHHLRIEGVVVGFLEVAVLEDALRVLPDGLLDVLRRGEGTFTRILMSWSR